MAVRLRYRIECDMHVHVMLIVMNRKGVIEIIAKQLSYKILCDLISCIRTDI